MNPRWWVGTAFLLVLLFHVGVCVVQGASWRHLDVWLKNEAGDRITPARNSTDPYSPRKTCGECHGYLTITEGYHFQQGFNGRDKKDRRPAPGLYATGIPLPVIPEPVAEKINRDARRMGLPLYDWIGTGGLLLPGGGPLEYGRRPDGRPDFSRRLSEAESLVRASLDGDYSSRYTPDRRSHFRQSGLIEADCLLCHQAGYRMDSRAREIGKRNYRWAATAGAGLGNVQGAVFTVGSSRTGLGEDDSLSGNWNFSRKPVVGYHWQNRGLFTADGKLRGAVVQKDVPSQNCLHCHQDLWGMRTGTLYSVQSDAHAGKGMVCTDCHPLLGKNSRERLRHQIAKETATCTGCHLKSQYRPGRDGMPREARNPQKTHAARFTRGSFHFLMIRCTGCHVTAQHARGGYLLDESAGNRSWYTADGLEAASRLDDFTSPAAEPWKPWIMRVGARGPLSEQYAPYVPLVRQWFGERTVGGDVRPIPSAYVRQAAKKMKGLTVVEVKGAKGRTIKRHTVATEAEAISMLKALSALGFRRAVFVSDQVYELKGGDLVTSKGAAAGTLSRQTLYHGVAPLKSRLTYGAKGSPGGCLDCHSDSAPFFTKMKILNIGRFLKEDYPTPKEPNAEPQMQEWGINSVPAYE